MAAIIFHVLSLPLRTGIPNSAITSKRSEPFDKHSSQSQATMLKLPYFPLTLTFTPPSGDLSARLAGLRAGREWVELREVQQEGTFGRVYRAVYQPPDQPHPTPVTIKTVTGGSEATGG